MPRNAGSPAVHPCWLVRQVDKQTTIWHPSIPVPFTPVNSQKAFVQVAEQISGAIEQGEFEVGEMLPSERELCQRMAVSRPVMREALSALHLLGIVQTRPGRGTFVGNEAPHALGARIWALAAEENPLDVMEMRLIVEPAAARLAATRASPGTHSAAAQVLEEMRAVAADATDVRRFGRLDLLFHQAVADASANSVISKFTRALIGYANQRLWQSMRENSYQHSTGLASRYLVQHERTYRCLVAGDEEGAAASMLDHLQLTREAIWAGGPDQDSGEVGP